MARCPAHDDREPSLSIRDGGDGRVLVHCHAGCEQWRVIEVVRSRRLWKEKGHRRFLYSAPRVRANDCPDRDNEKRSAAALGIWKSGTQAGGSLVEWARAELPAPANDAGKPIASDNKEADHDR